MAQASTVPTLHDAGPFAAKTHYGVLVANEHYISTPDAYNCMRDGEPNFDEFCAAGRAVEEAICDNQNLAEAIAVMLNRAYVMGAGGMGTIHVTPRG